MALIVKYSQAQYQAKITELEGYYNQLSQHLATMQDLKNQMYTFWEDENAQKAGQVLAEEIRHVTTTMDRTHETIAFYKSSIEKLDGVNVDVGGLFQDALSVLGTLM